MKRAIIKFCSKGTSRKRCFSASVVDQETIPSRVVVSHSSDLPAYSQDRVGATNLVDELLQYTRSLMDGSHHHIIAYSGGIDSSLVAALVQESANDNERVRAVLGLSPAVPAEQVTLAEEVAGFIGIPLEKIQTTESSDEMYIENSGQACLACKTHLYSCLDAVFEHTGAAAGDRKLYNGTNIDDLKDPTRLGLIAADSFSVQSPLRVTTKDNVRVAAKLLGLPNWNYAASPCLRSRLALGVEAIPQHLERIEKAERHVRQSLSLDLTNNLRVRLLAKGKAMVEVEDKALVDAKDSLKFWNPFFQELGFSSVDVRAFKSGSVAT
mmetsp:Transcript_10848/g.26235  ORF Transcript_10848/g.26235 Transcript_10848/m.26235 type:complete len:324 (-) Transcript_10848:712-1683(-)